MKVIAVQGNEKILVSMDTWELAYLAGKHSHEIDNQGTRLVNKEFEVCKAWQTICNLTERHKELANAAARLRAVADLLQPIACEVNQAISGEALQKENHEEDL
jgi:hypothetical protein